MTEQQQFQMMLKALTEGFVKHIPFHNFLGIHIAGDDVDHLSIRLDMKPELIGNYMSEILHGGVIATLLDAVGGLNAYAEVLKKLEGLPSAEQIDQLGKGATIDLRIDYLRPGVGKHFVATGEVLRSGSKVTVTRMALHNDDQKLIAVGSGTYLISL